MPPLIRASLGVLILVGVVLVTAMLFARAAGSGAYLRDMPLSSAVERLRPHVEVRLPTDAAGPVPAVLLLSGCGGLRQVQADYAEALNAAGLAAVVVDSFALRGIGRNGARLTVCTGARMWGQVRAADLFAALEIVRADPRLDAERLALVGWSHGGWTILDALSFAAEAAPPPGLEALPEAPLRGVRASLLVYPYCGAPVRARERPLPPGTPVTALLVSEDLIAPAEDCQALLEARRREGAAADYVLREGLTHAFDAPDQPPDPRMRYDAEAAAASRAWSVQRLKAAFAAPHEAAG